MASPVRLRYGRPVSAASSRFVFRLKGNIKGAGNGGTEPGTRRYRSGDTVRQSGIYEVLHDRDHREPHDVVMISGEHFPDCETCKERVRFRLIRTAPYIFQDEDFEEEK